MHHLDLEGIPLRDDAVEVNARQQLARVAAKPGCAVAHLETEQCAAVHVGAPRKQEPVPRPSDDLTAPHVARPHRQSATTPRGIHDRLEVLRAVRAVRVHLDQEPGAFGQPDPERVFVRAAETELALSMHDPDALVGRGETVGDVSGSVWRGVVDDEHVVAEVPDAFVNGPRERRLPGNLNVSFDRVESDSVMMAMRHFSLSSGSACSSGERSASPVLTAIGVPESLAYGSIRFGLGKSNTAEHIALLVDDLKRNIGRLREISAA